MVKTFFTSDTHFGHRNIIKYSNRPFSKTGPPGLDGQPTVFLDADAMDEEMIRRWNEVVGPDDIVYHLGDFSMGKRPASFYLDRLNGHIHLIWGNHDSDQVRELPRWASSQPYLEIKLDGHFIVLCHYSMRVWNKSHRGGLMLYGHSHGSLPGYSNSCDVGADCFDLRPVQLPDILRRMRTFPEYKSVDHHGE